MKICISDSENFPKPTLFSPLFILQLGVPSGKKIEASSLEKLTSLRDKSRDTDKMVESGQISVPALNCSLPANELPYLSTHISF